MGQTLTHGVYLPDEGERNCYAGLAANWQILDTSVGTIAAHTSALAGKAPLVHTHTVSQITDFPAYGNAAGTICEGNDSRLSDARTPVAHTHTKSDVTDLFNSANAWTDLQSYTQSIKIKVTYTIGTVPSSELYGGFTFGNSGTNLGNVTARVSNTGATYTRLYIGNKFANGALDPNGTWKYVELQVGLRANGDRFIYTDGGWRNSLTPYDSNLDLGNSNNKWKTLNGINPGALSLPSDSYVEIDRTNWMSGTTRNRVYINGANPTYPGWLFIRMSNVASTDGVIVRLGSAATDVTVVGSAYDGNIYAVCPCPPNHVISVYFTGTITYCRYHTCLGNV